jgi:S-adenosylmethionine decarboxylase
METTTEQTVKFGEHLTIDGYGGNKEKLNDKNLVLEVLEDLPNLLHMHKLSQPEIYFAQGSDKKDPGGWSGFVVIEESHISIHTFPARRFVSADVYTCSEGLNVEYILHYFKKMFDLEDIEHHHIDRGTRYPVNNIA